MAVVGTVKRPTTAITGRASGVHSGASLSAPADLRAVPSTSTSTRAAGLARAGLLLCSPDLLLNIKIHSNLHSTAITPQHPHTGFFRPSLPSTWFDLDGFAPQHPRIYRPERALAPAIVQKRIPACCTEPSGDGVETTLNGKNSFEVAHDAPRRGLILTPGLSEGRCPYVAAVEVVVLLLRLLRSHDALKSVSRYDRLQHLPILHMGSCICGHEHDVQN